jgi:DNA invertase Pin-like site-specific DNA recombinase
MANTLIGYARCSTDKQDLTAQRRALIELGVPEDRIYTDHGLTGRNRDRPGLAQALAAVRAGETLVVPKLDRLARSVPDARAIADELEKRGVSLALGKQVSCARLLPCSCAGAGRGRPWSSRRLVHHVPSNHLLLSGVR